MNFYLFCAIALAINGSTALPICFNIELLVPLKIKVSSNDCNAANSRGVSTLLNL